MTGMPHAFASRAEFDDLVASLVATGMIDDGSNIYWDVRPSSHVETLEFRVADVCLTVDEAVMVAGLCRALARACHDDWSAGEPVEPIRPELLRAAKLAGLAVRARRRPDRRPGAGVPSRAHELVEALLAFSALAGRGRRLGRGLGRSCRETLTAATAPGGSVRPSALGTDGGRRRPDREETERGVA